MGHRGQQHPNGDKAKGAVAIDAFPGLGKTTSVLAFARQYRRREINAWAISRRPVMSAGRCAG